MGKSSRDKGARFERAVAKKVGDVFERQLRRVPMSGGLDIKCDIYDPTDDSFPLFIECKHREEYRWSTLWSGDSPLYGVMQLTQKKARESYLWNKYERGPWPLVIFKGGDFAEPFVMFTLQHELIALEDHVATLMPPLLHCRPAGKVIHYRVMRLDDYLLVVDTSPLKVGYQVGQEDDGEY